MGAREDRFRDVGRQASAREILRLCTPSFSGELQIGRVAGLIRDFPINDGRLEGNGCASFESERWCFSGDLGRRLTFAAARNRQ